MILPIENGKNEHNHWIMHIWISLGIKFYFEQIILNFGTKLAQICLIWFFGTRVFPVEKSKSEHRQGILHIWISLA